MTDKFIEYLEMSLIIKIKILFDIIISSLNEKNYQNNKKEIDEQIFCMFLIENRKELRGLM